MRATLTSKFAIQTLIVLLVATMGYHSRANINVPFAERYYSTEVPLQSRVIGRTGTENLYDEMFPIFKKIENITVVKGKVILSTVSITQTTSSKITSITTATPAVSAFEPHDGALSTSPTNVRNNLGKENNLTYIISKSETDIKFILPKQLKTDAPMLNYIFDSFSTANKHHHHDQRYGPHFEDIITDGNVTNITVQAGGTIYLNCRISLLQDKTVSWVKRKANGENALQLLTVGMHTYSGDSRFTMEFQYPNNWRLKIGLARKSDEGIYECQISTHPPRVIQINLYVNAPEVMIVDEHGAALQEKYYEIDSTLQLSCIVRNVVMSTSVVTWIHGDQILNYDTTRGGVSVKTELMEDGANSTLFIARINKSDSGNYTCSIINSSQDYNIMIHVLSGESFAELHHGSSSRVITYISPITLYILLLLTSLIYSLLQSVR